MNFLESLKDKSDKYLELLSNNYFLKMKIVDAEIQRRKYEKMELEDFGDDDNENN